MTGISPTMNDKKDSLISYKAFSHSLIKCAHINFKTEDLSVLSYLWKPNAKIKRKENYFLSEREREGV